MGFHKITRQQKITESQPDPTWLGFLPAGQLYLRLNSRTSIDAVRWPTHGADSGQQGVQKCFWLFRLVYHRFYPESDTEIGNHDCRDIGGFRSEWNGAFNPTVQTRVRPTPIRQPPEPDRKPPFCPPAVHSACLTGAVWTHERACKPVKKFR